MKAKIKRKSDVLDISIITGVDKDEKNVVIHFCGGSDDIVVLDPETALEVAVNMLNLYRIVKK